MATTYVILRSLTAEDAGGHEAALLPVGLAEAGAAETAIRRYRDTLDAPAETSESTWHAVPVGNWTTVEAAVEVPEPRTVYTEKPSPFGELTTVAAPVSTPRPAPAAAAEDGNAQPDPVAADEDGAA